MAPISGAELAAVCRDADPEAVAGFVAALHEARGRAVEYEDGPAFTLVGDAGRERVVVPADGTAPPDADTDVFVVAGRSVEPVGTARTVDADALRDALLYAVDRERADRLLDRWFDRPLDSFEGDAGTGDGTTTPPLADDGDGNGDGDGERAPDREAGPDESAGHLSAGSDSGAHPPAFAGEPVDSPGRTGADRAHTGGRNASGRPEDADAGTDDDAEVDAGTDDGRRPVAVAAAAVVVVGVLVVAAVVAVGWTVGAPAGGAGTGPTPTSSPVPAAAAASGTAPTATPVSSGAVRQTGPLDGDVDAAPDGTASAQLTALPNYLSPLPPGVDRDGIVDYGRLVRAHRAQLSGNSYRIVLVYRESVGRTATGVVTQTVRVENATRYRATSMRFGEFQSPPPTLVEDDAFADGTTRYERTAEGVRREPVAGVDRFLDRQSRYLRWYLSVEESWVADREAGSTTTTVRLASRGDPWPGVTNATGGALVTDEGLVRAVRRSYDDPDSRARVVVTMWVSDAGRTTVSPPRWVREASSPADD